MDGCGRFFPYFSLPPIFPLILPTTEKTPSAEEFRYRPCHFPLSLLHISHLHRAASQWVLFASLFSRPAFFENVCANTCLPFAGLIPVPSPLPTLPQLSAYMYVMYPNLHETLSSQKLLFSPRVRFQGLGWWWWWFGF